jgi:hypothetical protein
MKIFAVFLHEQEPIDSHPTPLFHLIFSVFSTRLLSSSFDFVFLTLTSLHIDVSWATSLHL